eukprot:4272433-Alexandrium_andersonii.AAC.1
MLRSAVARPFGPRAEGPERRNADLPCSVARGAGPSWAGTSGTCCAHLPRTSTARFHRRSPGRLPACTAPGSGRAT